LFAILTTGVSAHRMPQNSSQTHGGRWKNSVKTEDTTPGECLRHWTD